jgi:hypothetical protein
MAYTFSDGMGDGILLPSRKLLSWPKQAGQLGFFLQFRSISRPPRGACRLNKCVERHFDRPWLSEVHQLRGEIPMREDGRRLPRFARTFPAQMRANETLRLCRESVSVQAARYKFPEKSPLLGACDETPQSFQRCRVPRMPRGPLRPKHGLCRLQDRRSKA